MYKKIIIGLLMLIASVSITYGGNTFELGNPATTWAHAKIWVVKITKGGLKGCYWSHYDGNICMFPGIQLVHVEINDPDSFEPDEDINFMSGNIFAQFKGGPFWNRIGFGLGLFDKTTKKGRSRWDFSMSWQLGMMVFESHGIFLGFEHWSNGRSVADVVGIVGLWPEYNDGGDVMLLGYLYEW